MGGCVVWSPMVEVHMARKEGSPGQLNSVFFFVFVRQAYVVVIFFSSSTLCFNIMLSRSKLNEIKFFECFNILRDGIGKEADLDGCVVTGKNNKHRVNSEKKTVNAERNE